MVEITVDASKCKRCGTCGIVCIRRIFRQNEPGDLPEVVDREHCMDCGHCVAICPAGAITHSSFPEGSVGSIDTAALPTYEQVFELIRSRRSKRAFRDAPVERKVIEQMLEAARFAPSGHNAQGTMYAVVQDRDRLHEIGTLTGQSLRKLVKPFQSPIGRIFMRLLLDARQVEVVAGYAPELLYLADVQDKGTDVFLNEAPTLVLFHAQDNGGMAVIDANLQLQNAMLAAEALGLGCFYTGFVTMACQRDQRIAEFLSLPEGHKILGTLAVGYPRLTFKKWPERKPARITWL
jgi:nitroreductase/NAD-dependent dihydropyrimidine dehydrogenase PreA subunit